MWVPSGHPFRVTYDCHGCTHSIPLSIPVMDTTTWFSAAGSHFYCETLDVSRPFPSEQPVHQPSWPFVWNRALSLPFRMAGLDGPNTVCPALLQVRAVRLLCGQTVYMTYLVC